MAAGGSGAGHQDDIILLEENSIPGRLRPAEGVVVTVEPQALGGAGGAADLLEDEVAAPVDGRGCRTPTSHDGPHFLKSHTISIPFLSNRFLLSSSQKKSS